VRQRAQGLTAVAVPVGEGELGLKPIWIAKTGTFQMLLEMMCRYDVHRVYVAEQHGCHIHPLTVITATDVLHTVMC
jgi:hypothetical protein